MPGFDVIVVGAGSAGCALAARLSENPDRRVLLLEAGPDHPMTDPAATPAPLTTQGWDPRRNPEFGWHYEGLRRPDRPDPVHVYRGRVTGGSGAVNSGMFLHGPPEDFLGWGSDLWSWSAVEPHLRAVEADLDFPGGAHGTGGPIPVGRGRLDECSPFQRAFHAAALKRGVPDKPDLNGPDGGGVGLVPRNDVAGLRMSTAAGYLAPARRRPNLTVLGDAPVRRIGFTGTRATHVDALVGGGPERFEADEIVLAAGAVETPHLLMLSGIGPAAELARLGLPVLVDAPGTGRNLSDHPVAILEYEPGPDGAAAPPVMGSTPPRCAAVLTAEGSELRNDLLVLPVDTAHFRTPPSFAREHDATPATRIRVHCMLQLPYSRGRLELSAADPAAAPRIHFDYLTDRRDLVRMRDGVRTAAELLEPVIAAGHAGPRTTPTDADLASDAALESWLLATFNTCYHSAGTARMGADDDPGAVVDGHARVRGVQGLRIADLSIAPHVSRGTTNPVAVLIGERVAALMGAGAG